MDFDDSDSIPVELQERVKMCKYADDCTTSESIKYQMANYEKYMQKVLAAFRTGQLRITCY